MNLDYFVLVYYRFNEDLNMGYNFSVLIFFILDIVVFFIIFYKLIYWWIFEFFV